MSDNNNFAKHASEYDNWYEEFHHIYDAEKRAVRCLLPTRLENSLEIGVGSGRFAASLGVRVGIDPSCEMLAIAQQRKVVSIQAVAEKLPFTDHSFDSLLMVTVLCFLHDPIKALYECRRVLHHNGRMVIAFIDRLSVLGEKYSQKQSKSTFYRDAKFYTVDDVTAMLTQVGFEKLTFVQTLINPLEKINESEPVLAGAGKGSFVVVAAE